MNIKEILKSQGIEENVEAIIEAINKEIPKSFIPKDQYNKKAQELKELQMKHADMEAKLSDASADEYKEKFEALQKEYDDFKNNLEVEKTNSTKTQLLKETLKNDGLKNDKLANLLLKEFDLDTIELEDNKIKGYEELSKTIKENYSDFFSKTQVVGNDPATPPIVSNGKTYSLDTVKEMSKEDIRKNYFEIQKQLSKK